MCFVLSVDPNVTFVEVNVSPTVANVAIRNVVLLFSILII